MQAIAIPGSKGDEFKLAKLTPAFHLLAVFVQHSRLSLSDVHSLAARQTYLSGHISLEIAFMAQYLPAQPAHYGLLLHILVLERYGGQNYQKLARLIGM